MRRSNYEITIFQKKPMHTALKRLEPHMRNCSKNMVWETVPDFRSCVDEASVQLMSLNLAMIVCFQEQS